MKIALIGYGKMGRAIGEIALKRGHKIVSVIDIDNMKDFETETFRSANVAIEFTTPSTAFENYQKCFAADIPVISGTTGWTDRIDEIRKQCDNEGKTFFYASNFSIGVNIFFALNKYLARMIDKNPEYEVSIKEIHHKHKLDIPSGTAITLAEGIIDNMKRKTGWEVVSSEKKDFKPNHYEDEALPKVNNSLIEITAFREGETPGYHEIKYESDIDEISIFHNAKSRAGFAMGAVLAAEFTLGKKGFLTMNDLLKL